MLLSLLLLPIRSYNKLESQKLPYLLHHNVLFGISTYLLSLDLLMYCDLWYLDIYVMHTRFVHK